MPSSMADSVAGTGFFIFRADDGALHPVSESNATISAITKIRDSATTIRVRFLFGGWESMLFRAISSNAHGKIFPRRRRIFKSVARRQRWPRNEIGSILPLLLSMKALPARD